MYNLLVLGFDEFLECVEYFGSANIVDSVVWSYGTTPYVDPSKDFILGFRTLHNEYVYRYTRQNPGRRLPDQERADLFMRIKDLGQRINVKVINAYETLTQGMLEKADQEN